MYLNAVFGDLRFSDWVCCQGHEEVTVVGSICMMVFVLNLFERCNGVVEIHGGVLRRMWAGYDIGHVINGVYVGIWVVLEV